MLIVSVITHRDKYRHIGNICVALIQIIRCLLRDLYKTPNETVQVLRICVGSILTVSRRNVCGEIDLNIFQTSELY